MAICDYEGFVEDTDEVLAERNEGMEALWEKQQKSTFTAWCNSHLRKVGCNINAIDEDFRDGLKLMKLLEVMSGEWLPKPDKGKMRVHKIANVNKCLKYIQSMGVHLVSIGAEEIVDGNVKMTLGMIWTIILRFAIQDICIEDMSAKEGLLLWCQRKTSPYRNVRINNFHMSFKDGLAFCALIHRHRPELIDYKSLSRENAEYNLNLAFDVAEKHLDIPRMLNVEDMVSTVKPDQLSVMAYVSSYYHAFSGAHKAETACARICNVINVNQDNEKLINNYDGLSSSLLSWINDKINYLNNRVGSAIADEICKVCDEFRQYRREEKPPKFEEKGKLETDYNTLQTRLRLSNRPQFIPKDGIHINNINNRWRDLERKEKEYEDWLMAEMKRIEQLDHLLKNFYLRCNTHEAWSAGKVDILESNDYVSSNVSELRALLKKQEAFESDLNGHTARIKRICEIAAELRHLNYNDMETIDARLGHINNEWDKMNVLNDKRKNDIRNLHSMLEDIDQLHLDYAKQVAPFFNWIEQSKEDLQDSHMLHYIEEVKILIEKQKEFEESLAEADKQYSVLENIDKRIQDIVNQQELINVDENPYTLITQEVVHKQWEELKSLMPKRDLFLKKELNHQIENENIRQEFVSLASKLGPWIDEKQTTVNNLGCNDEHLTLEKQKTVLENLRDEMVECRSLAENVDKCIQNLHANMIFETPNCPYTMETLRVSWDQLQSSIRQAIVEIDNQILTRDSKGISKSQMDEFVRCFNHFDKNRTKVLEPNEFRALLVSLGYNLKEEKKIGLTERRPSMGEADFLRIMTEVDPENTGAVTFDAFIDFMAKETVEQDTVEQILQSFKILAGDKEYITADELRRELPPQQAEYCISQMMPYPDGGPNALDYQLFASSLYGHSDL